MAKNAVVLARRTPLAGKQQKGHDRSQSTAGYLFALPYTLFLVAFGMGPALYAVVISFAGFQNGTPRYFAAGLKNFATAFSFFAFKSAFTNMALFVLISVPIGILGVTVIALLLHARSGWFTAFARTLFFVPGAVAGPALILLAIFMLDPRLSPFGPVLQAFGWHDKTDVITFAHLSPLFTAIGFFGGAGGWVAIFYSALKGIPTEILEAARVDGCSAWQSALFIKLPLISRYIIFMGILTFAGNIQIFTEPQLISTTLMDNNPVPAGWSPNILAYNFAFTYGNFGAAAVVSFVMIAIGLVVAFLVIYRTDFYRTDVTSA